METIRSFIAIELPEELKDELSRLENELKKASGAECARWVDPYGIHLTLKFLGNIKRGQVSDISRAMGEVCRGLSPFQLKVTELGGFPNLRRVQVIWVGVGGEIERLIELQKKLDDELYRLGFTPETRFFAPHLTLARIRDNTPPITRHSLGELLARTKPRLTSPIEVKAINLMRSELTPKGAIYSKIGTAPLGKEA